MKKIIGYSSIFNNGWTRLSYEITNKTIEKWKKIKEKKLGAKINILSVLHESK